LKKYPESKHLATVHSGQVSAFSNYFPKLLLSYFSSWYNLCNPSWSLFTDPCKLLGVSLDGSKFIPLKNGKCMLKRKEVLLQSSLIENYWRIILIFSLIIVKKLHCKNYLTIPLLYY